jgi:CspA family cold shock protein
MSVQLKSASCQRCGSGFVLTESYLDLLRRRQVKVARPQVCPTCFVTKGPLPKQVGVVKWFSLRKRYGFITNESGEDAFFHIDQFLGDNGQNPHEGQTVQFHIHFPAKGPEALNVELVEM